MGWGKIYFTIAFVLAQFSWASPSYADWTEAEIQEYTWKILSQVFFFQKKGGHPLPAEFNQWVQTSFLTDFHYIVEITQTSKLDISTALSDLSKTENLGVFKMVRTEIKKLIQDMKDQPDSYQVSLKSILVEAVYRYEEEVKKTPSFNQLSLFENTPISFSSWIDDRNFEAAKAYIKNPKILDQADAPYLSLIFENGKYLAKDSLIFKSIYSVRNQMPLPNLSYEDFHLHLWNKMLREGDLKVEYYSMIVGYLQHLIKSTDKLDAKASAHIQKLPSYLDLPKKFHSMGMDAELRILKLLFQLKYYALSNAPTSLLSDLSPIEDYVLTCIEKFPKHSPLIELALELDANGIQGVHAIEFISSLKENFNFFNDPNWSGYTVDIQKIERTPYFLTALDLLEKSKKIDLSVANSTRLETLLVQVIHETAGKHMVNGFSHDEILTHFPQWNFERFLRWEEKSAPVRVLHSLLPTPQSFIFFIFSPTTGTFDPPPPVKPNLLPLRPNEHVRTFCEFVIIGKDGTTVAHPVKY